MLSHIVKDVPPFVSIVANQNKGDAERLIKKFGLSDGEVRALRYKFEQKRSGRLKSY